MYRVGLAVLAFTALACGSRSPPDGELRDHAGDVIALEGPAKRIVSLSPALTELLFTLGVGDRVVGRTRWGQDPEAALAVPSVGDGLNPNIEAVVARHPDLVLFYLSPSNGVAIERLNGLRIATASIRLDGLADLADAARLIGELVGATGVDSILTAFETQLNAVTAGASERPEVLLLAWDNPPIASGGASFQSEIVERAGATCLPTKLSRRFRLASRPSPRGSPTSCSSLAETNRRSRMPRNGKLSGPSANAGS